MAEVRRRFGQNHRRFLNFLNDVSQRIGERICCRCQFTDFVRRPLPFPTVVVGSDDDPYATAMWSRDFADGLGAAYVNAGPFGHLNADSGLGDWPWGQGLVAGFAAALP